MKKTALASVIFLLCLCLTGMEMCAVAQSKQPSPSVSLYTNLAYDAALVPNVGVQVGLPQGWTVSAAWNGSWWGGAGHSWRIYGPELTVRRYFSDWHLGHHAGLYGQMLTYDVQMKGHTGYIGGEPGGNLFDRANWGIGAEYGYTFRLTERLDLDLSIGLGYFGGKYYTYEYLGGQYVWQTTARRNFFGPTRVGVTLYWNL